MDNDFYNNIFRKIVVKIVLVCEGVKSLISSFIDRIFEDSMSKILRFNIIMLFYELGAPNLILYGTSEPLQ